MRKQVPNYKKFEVHKAPKTIENPDKFYDLPISWQLSYIDEESRWGTKSLRENFSIGDFDGIFSEIQEMENDVLDAIHKVIDKKYNDLPGMVRSLAENSKGKLTIEVLCILLSHLNENPFWQKIFSKIQHFETTSWQRVLQEQHGKKGKTKHHYVDISDIDPEAQKRLRKLGFDDIGSLCSIRFEGKLRIWGIKKLNYFKVLWFDLEHEICPTER